VVLARALTNRATLLLGTPYRTGGADPRGFDCSGFIEWVFAAEGIAVPRTVAELYSVGYPVPRQQIEPGDLVFFATTASGPTHVGLALDNGDFVHAPNARGRVRLDRLATPYWAARFLGGRRITAQSASGIRRPAG
jgi:cell wall-associated NlpC family hydrolase